MKTFLKQFGKALCYFLLFFLSQNFIGIIYQFVYGFKAGYEATVAGVELDVQAMTEGIVTYINEKSVDIILISGCLTVLILWLFFLIRKKSLLKETNIVKFSGKYIPILIVLGIGMQIFLAFGMGLLPEEIIADYANNVNQKFGIVSIVAVLAQVVAAPVVEEVIFRGLMLSRLRKGMPTIVAALISSVVFGLIHGQILWMAYAFVLGLIFAMVAIKTGSILSTILLHAVFNGAGVILSLMTVDIPVLVYIILTVVGAIVTFGALYLVMKKQPEAKVQ